MCQWTATMTIVWWYCSGVIEAILSLRERTGIYNILNEKHIN